MFAMTHHYNRVISRRESVRVLLNLEETSVAFKLYLKDCSRDQWTVNPWRHVAQLFDARSEFMLTSLSPDSYTSGGLAPDWRWFVKGQRWTVTDNFKFMIQSLELITSACVHKTMDALSIFERQYQCVSLGDTAYQLCTQKGSSQTVQVYKLAREVVTNFFLQLSQKCSGLSGSASLVAMASAWAKAEVFCKIINYTFAYLLRSCSCPRS